MLEYGFPLTRIHTFFYKQGFFSSQLQCYLNWGEVNLTPCGFSKNVSSKKGMKPWFFVTFNIILRQICPENLIEFPQVVQKIRTISPSILAISINFYRFFGFFDITLLQRS